MDIKQLKREYNRSVNAYLEAFCDKHGFDYTEAVKSWVDGRVGDMVIIGDYFFDFETIRTDMDEDAPEEELMKHYLNAAENILRRGISELWSGSKTVSDTVSRACTQESHVL